jgi:hypothetical protein
LLGVHSDRGQYCNTPPKTKNKLLEKATNFNHDKLLSKICQGTVARIFTGVDRFFWFRLHHAIAALFHK